MVKTYRACGDRLRWPKAADAMIKGVGLIEISLTRHTLQLPLGLAARMPIGADVAAAEPAVIGAILIRTEVPRGVDRASASPGEDHHRGWRTGCLGRCIGALLTGLAYRFVDISRERFGLFRAFASGFAWLERRLGWGTWMVRPPDMDEETTQH
jgi:hypothetical protein